MRSALLFLLTLSLISAFNATAQSSNKEVRTLIVIFDGLRPDYITPQHMPNLYSLKRSGCYVPYNHSAFPTVTRVNASSYATGSYPSTHGLMGNTVYFPKVDKVRGLDTGDAKELMRIQDAENNKLLTAVSLGEILNLSGSSMMVFSSGSSGQAFLQNHTISGGVINPELILPARLRDDVIEEIGPPPPPGKPNIRQHDWAARAFLHYGLADDGPLVSAIWFSDPDGTAHSYGIGSPQAMESIKAVDEQFGFILRTLENRNLMDQFNIIVTADHGFATRKGKNSLSDFLIGQGLKKSKDSDDVILAGNAIYVKDSNRKNIKKIVSALQAQPWVGAIFTEGKEKDSPIGWVDGTLSFDVIHWDHTRSGDILVDYSWDDDVNAYGYIGSSFGTGVAGHGGASPYEINIPLVASGPAFKKQFESSLPCSNTDIVPTILNFYGLEIPPSMNGRVLHELLVNDSGSKDLVARKETFEALAKIRSGTCRVTIQRTVVENQHYVDFVRTDRE